MENQESTIVCYIFQSQFLTMIRPTTIKRKKERKKKKNDFALGPLYLKHLFTLRYDYIPIGNMVGMECDYIPIGNMIGMECDYIPIGKMVGMECDYIPISNMVGIESYFSTT